MPRQVKDHGGITSDEWCTPPEVADPLFQFWGYADWDPCTNARSVVKTLDGCFEKGGLIRPYRGKTWQNHPYSQNDVWAPKAISELKAGHAKELVILCMTATSTLWWQSLMNKPKRNPRVICTKRLPFLGPKGEPVDSSRFEPALIYYGPNAKRFDACFRSIARWSTWGR